MPQTPNSQKLFLAALGVSFMGSLPIGTLNISVAFLVVNKGIPAAIRFAIGAIGVEVILVRLAVTAVKKLEGFKKLFKVFGFIACALLLLFAYTSIAAAIRMDKFMTAVPTSMLDPFFSGLLLSILNPLHLPFWMGWTSVFRSKNILDDTPKLYNIFVTAIGVGTSLAFTVYGWAGDFLIVFLQMQQNILNWIVGIALLITALLQLHKLLRPNATATLPRPKSSTS